MVWIRIGVPILTFGRRVNSQTTRSAISAGYKHLSVVQTGTFFSHFGDYHPRADGIDANVQLLIFALDILARALRACLERPYDPSPG